MPEFSSDIAPDSPKSNAVADTVSGLFSALADAMPQMIFVTDPDGSHFYYNRGWYDYTGLSPSESMGFGFATVLHPNDQARTLAAWREAWKNGAEYEIEYRFRRKDGVYRWFVGRAAPVKDAGTGAVRMWVGTCTDIDDTRRAFDVQSEAQERLSLALQTARLGTWEYDYATQNFTFSERAQELFDVASPTVPYMLWSQLLHEDDRDAILTAAAAFLQAEPPYDASDAVISVGYRVRRQGDGVIYHLLVKGSRLTDADGKPIRAAGVIQDVTESQNYIDSLQQSFDIQSEAQARLAVALRAAHLGTWQYDLATQTVVASAEMREIFGIAVDGVFSIADFSSRIHPDYRDDALAAFGRVVTRDSDEFSARYPVVRSDGTVRHAHLLGRFHPGTEDGDAGRISGVIQDVTESQTTLDALRKSYDALSESREILTLALKTARLGTWEFDNTNGQITTYPFIRELFGFAPDEVPALEPFFERIHEADRGAVQNVFAEALSGRSEYFARYRVVRPDNTVRYLQSRATPVRDADGVVTRLIGITQDITEEQTTLDALRESAEALAIREAQYRFLFDTVASGVVYQDGDSRILDANAAAEEILGLTLAQMSGRDSLDPRWRAVREDGSDFPGDQHPVPVALRTGEPVRGVTMGVFHPQAGRYRWISVSAVPLFKPGATRPYLVYAYFEDQTEQREAERLLRESEGRFRLAAQSARLGVFEIIGNWDQRGDWLHDDGAAFLRYDALFGDLFDLPADGSGTVSDIFRRVTPDQWTKSTRLAGEALENGTSYNDEYSVRHPSTGAVRWVRTTGQRYLEGTLGRFVGTVQDITAERIAEQSVRESEERFRLAARASRLGVWEIVGKANETDRWYTTPDAATIRYDARFAELFGIPEDGSVSLLDVVKSIDRDTRDGAQETAVRTITANDSVSQEYDDEYRVLRPTDGSVCWIRSTGRMYVEGEQGRFVGTVQDITEQRLAKEALRDSELRYRTLIDVSPQTIWTATPDGRMDYASPSWFAYSGATEEQTYNTETLFEQIHPDDRASVAKQWTAAVASGTPYENEMRWRGAGGDHRWFTSRAIPVRDDSGTVVRWQGVTFDIHDRKQAEAALREEEERFRALADNISQLAWMTDETGWIFWYNQRWFDYTGTTLDEMKGWGWQKIHHPDTVDSVTAKFADFVKRGETWEDTFPIRGADGNYRWFLSRAIPLRDESGQIVRWFGTNTDVTDVRAAAVAIRQSEERFRSLVTATAQIVWTTDADGLFVGEQAAWANFTGQAESEYAGRRWMTAVHEDDRDETLRQWETALSAQTTLATEHRLRRKDGEYRYMAVRAVPVRETDGTVREWVGVHTDFSDQKEAEFLLLEYATKQAKVAETLQRSLLNSPPGDSFPGITVAPYYEAALDEAQVGGDFFDVFALKENRVALVVGDVTGKGLKAAEHTGQIKYALRAFLRENADPGDAVARVNRLLTDAQELDANYDPDDTNAMAAITVAVLNRITGRLLCAGGGAEFSQVYRAATGTVEEIVTGGVVVGAYSESTYQIAETLMSTGDYLVIATDGVTESRRSRREFFGNEGIAATLDAVIERGDATPDTVCTAIVQAAKQYSATGQFSDDVCLLVVRWTGV